MARNLATEYQPKVSERLSTASVTAGLVNRNYRFKGGNTIVVYSVDTMELNDYDRDGGPYKFGTPNNIGTTIQTFEMEEEKSFTGTVEKLDDIQQMGVLKPGAILARQMREVIIPYIDSYILGVIDAAADAAGNDAIVEAGATTSDNAYSTFLALRSYSIDNEGPQNGYKATCTAEFYNFLKQGGFVTDSNMGQQIKRSGFLGLVDGTPFKISPSNRMADNVDLVVVHPMATTFAQQLKNFEVVPKVFGLDGPGIQGLEVFDAFVDINKVATVTEHKTA